MHAEFSYEGSYLKYDTVFLPHLSTANLPSSFLVPIRNNYGVQERDKKIAFIKKRMKELGYNPRSLSMAATGKPDTIRNLFRGASKHWRQDNYEAIMRVLGGGERPVFDDELMGKCVSAIGKALHAREKTINLAHAMTYTVMLYKYIIEYRAKGDNIEPSEAIAALILNQTAA